MRSVGAQALRGSLCKERPLLNEVLCAHFLFVRVTSTFVTLPSRDGRRQSQLRAQQEAVIERWAKAVGLWTDCVEDSLPQSLGEQIAEGGEVVVYRLFIPPLTSLHYQEILRQTKLIRDKRTTAR